MAHHTHDHAHDDGAVRPHIAPVSLYAGIFGALLVFTAITVLASYVHLGPWNLVVAIVIATIKATLVVLFFMHLKDDSRFNALVFLGSLVFVGVFLVYTLNDTETRGQVDDYSTVQVDPRTGEAAPGGMQKP